MDEPTPAPGTDDEEPDSEPRWRPEDRRLSPGAVAFLGLGLAIGLCLAVTVGAGLALDAVLHSSPVCLLVGLAIGLVVAVAMAVSTIRKYL
jgi:F0F1-type ATP synthase assembly protein I